MYERILVPTDGSDIAALATDHALDIAAKYDAEVHALYVIDLDAVDISLGTEQVQRIKDGKFDEMGELQERAAEATGVIADQAAEAGIECTEGIAAGRPPREIVDYGVEHDADMIVMTSHGRTGVSRLLVGSVTEKVVRLADIPVLVVDVAEEDM